MSRQFNKFLLKILLLAIAIVAIFNIWDNLINAKTNSKKVITNNENIFKKINNSEIWKTWVAISTNLWTRYKERKEMPATIYSDIFSISELKNNSTWNEELIALNMIITSEYTNVLKTNIKTLLENSNNKAEILDAVIEQLEFRYEKAVNQIKTLNSQKIIFEWEIEKSNKESVSLKEKINLDFKANKADESIKNIEKYLEIKNNYFYARTYIVYINQFLREYNALNKYNKELLDTLINNKNALIQSSFVVIPDSWSKLLKNFDLLYTEEEYKSK